jgi:hypothetical protein
MSGKGRFPTESSRHRYQRLSPAQVQEFYDAIDLIRQRRERKRQFLPYEYSSWPLNEPRPTV